MAICRDIKTPDRQPLGKPTLTVINWVNTVEPYFDSKTKTYNVAVDIAVSNKVEDINAILEQAKRPGIIRILAHYNKETTEQYISQLLLFVKTPEHFIQDRPSVPECPIFGIKVLVSIPESNFNFVPYKKSPAINVKTEITFRTSDVENELFSLAKKIENFDKDVSSFGGKVSGVSFIDEGKSIRGFYSHLKRLFNDNGYQLLSTKDELIIIGVDEQKKVQYVLLDSGDNLINLSIKFDVFQKSKFTQKRTIVFLENADEIQKTINNWGSLVQGFLDNPPGVEYFNKLGNQFGDALKEINDNPQKTEEQKIREDQTLASPKLKEVIYEGALTTNIFIGDNVLANTQEVVDTMNDLDDAFGNVLNKIGMKSVVAAAIRCLLQQLPLDEIIKILKLLRLLAMPCEAFKGLVEATGFRFTDLPFVRQALIENALGCLEKLSHRDRKIFFQNLSSVGGISVRNSAELVNLDTNTILNGLGDAGNRLILDVCDKNRESILEFLEGIGIRLDIEIPDFDFTFPDLEFPEITFPTITLPTLPTIDILSSLGEEIEKAIIEALTTAIVETIKQILLDVVKTCGDVHPPNFGVANVARIYAEKLGIGDASRVFASSIGTLVNNVIGIGQNLVNTAELFGKLLDDLSIVLSPSEMANVLEGRPNNDTIELISCLVGKKHQGLTPLLDGNKLQEVFNDLGKVVRREDLLAQLGNEDKYGTFYCDDDLANARKKILTDKGLSSDLIDQQLNQERARKIARLRSLASLFNKKNPLEGVINPDLCSGNVAKDIHPSFTNMVDKTINTIFDGIKMSFEQNVNGFIPAITEEAKVLKVPRLIPRKINATLENGDTMEIRNPEYARLLANGVIVENPDDDDGPPISTLQEETLATTQKVLAEKLKNNFLALETDTRFLNVQNNKVILSLPTSLQTPLLGQTIPLIGASFFEIEYELLSSTNDSFSLKIFSVDTQNNRKEILSLNEAVEMSETIKSLTSLLNLLRTDNNASIQQNYFSDLLVKSLGNGARIIENGISVNKPEYATGIQTTRNVSFINELIRPKLLNESFQQAFKDIIAGFASQVAKSPLFSKNTFSLINLTPNEKKCHIGLLGFEKLKQDTKNNTKCFSPSSRTGDKPKLGQIEKNSLEAVLTLMFRAHLSELFLRTSFLLAEFSLDKDNDDVFIKFFASRIKQELEKFDETYKQDVFDTLSDVLNNEEEVAVSEKAKNEYNFVANQMNTILGTKGNVGLLPILLREVLPIMEVGPSINRLSTPSFSFETFLSESTNKKITFNISNGNFILEYYVRTYTKDGASFPSSIQNTRSNMNGLYTFHEFENFLDALKKDYSTIPDFAGQPLMSRPDEFFSKINLGLRLTYIPPVDLSAGIDRDFERVYSLSAGKIVQVSQLEKAFRQDETFVVDGQEKIATTYPIPVVCVERSIDDLSNIPNIEELWRNKANELISDLKETAEVNVLFNFCLSPKRAISLLMIYCILYFENNESVKVLFNTTKNNLKSVFYSLLNAGSYQYQDPLNELGNVGLFNDVQNNPVPSGPNIASMAAGMALSTPIKILKGLIEISDPNLSIASKICDVAKTQGQNLPIQLVSLGLLPSNIIPLSPGPPISPLGFVYLATNAYDALSNETDKENVRNDIGQVGNLDLTKDKCEDK